MEEDAGVTYWPQLCGNESRDVFWDTNYTWTTNNPDLTRCFQDSVLVWLPCGYLIVVAFLYLPYLVSIPTSNTIRDTSLICGAKTVLCYFLAVVAIIDGILGSRRQGVPLVAILAPAVQAVTFVLAAVIVWLEFSRAVPSSGILIVFWLLQLLFGLIPFRSYIIHNNFDEFDFHSISFYIEYAFYVVLFVLHCVNDRKSDPEQKSVDEKTYLLVKEQDEPEDERDKLKPCPEKNANVISRIMFFWITKLVIAGYRRPLVFEDLWALLPEDSSATIVPRFKEHWEKHIKDTGWHMIKRKNKLTNDFPSYGSFDSRSVTGSEIPYKETSPPLSKPRTTEYISVAPGIEDKKKQQLPSFWKPLMGVFGSYYMLGGFFKFCYDIISFISPQLLSLLITFVAAGDPYEWHGYVYAMLLFVVSMVKTVLLQQYYHNSYKVGMQIRTAVIAFIYRKALVINSTAKQLSTVGEIVNLMSVDAQKLNDVPQYLHMLWSAPLTIAVAMYFLWQELGPSTLAGLFIMLLLVPLNAWLAQKIRSLQITQMKLKDNRIKLMNEVLNGIKVLKLYAWEESFQERLDKIREQELQTLKKMAFLNAGSGIAWTMAPYLVGLGSFAAFVLVSPDNVLDANKAFVSLSLFNLLNYPLAILPGVISYGVQAVVSMNRIGKFMRNEELDPNNVINDPQVSDEIKVSNVNVSWGNTNDAILKDINLSIPDGKLVAIVGSVGSGKSSLLSAMLGEMELTAGKVHLKGSVSYVPQQAWIKNATVKDNILFDKSYNQSKYRKVIEACALTPDLEILPGGDMTEIGEKGINLSGGQKQRVSLARAVYQNHAIYLLDDPLSAVDSHVGKHIFDNVIGPNGTLRGKTRVMVTNGLTYLPQVDTIVVLKDGSVSEMGSYHQLLHNNGAFAEFLAQYLNDYDEEDEDESKEFHEGLRRQISEISGTETGSASEGQGTTNEQTSKLRKRSRKIEHSKSEDHAIPGDGKMTKQKLIEEETAQTGNVKLSVFLTYLRYYGFINLSLTLGAYMIILASKSFASIWLSEWSNDPPEIDGTQNLPLRDLRLGVYGAMGVIQTFAVLSMSVALAYGTVRASRMVHSNLLRAVLRAPMSFFDTTPLGRILNRFSKDVDTIDFNVPLIIRIWSGTLSTVIITVFIISYSTPVFLIVLIPLTIFYFFVQRFYIATSRQLKRLESVRKSPIYAHFSETIAGTSTIRAYKASKRFTDVSDQLTDENNMAYYPNIISNRWLGIYLETIGNFIVLFAGLFAVTGSIDAGTAGLSVSFALQVTVNLNLVVRMTCDFENDIVAIERMQEYTECPQEAPAIIAERRPDIDWPQHGQVTFQDYSTRYRPGLDLVLRGVNCSFNPSERVGIVGRTGAGKSSLTLALFRIIESAAGSITIDGENIGTMGLADLRSNLTIIPQDPVLFSGNLRMNLDPFETKTDDELWMSLELAHLKSFVQSLPEKLEHPCSEGGENLSVGQRQLVCLARALLRKTRILVLDEATAAVDLETDELIQTTIRAEFKYCTVITIAHRLNTIMDYDRIAVMDGGNISEFASPSELLKNKDGIFYGMVKNAGLL